MKKGGAAKSKKSVAVFPKLTGSLDRSRKVQKQQEVAKVALTAEPLFAIVSQKFSDARDNVACSIFEVRSGLRGGVFSAHTNTDPVRELLKLPRCNELVQEMAIYLKQNQAGTIRLEMYHQMQAKKEIQRGFDGLLFRTLPLPQQDWAALVFELQFFGYGEQGLTVNFPPFCAMESRLLVQGEEIVIGFQPATVPGKNLKAKRSNLYQMSMDQVQALAGMSGNWASHHDSTEVLTIPTGFLCIYVSSGCMGYRWTCSGDKADTLRIIQSLTSLLDAFPEMNNARSGHVQWKEWLGSF